MTIPTGYRLASICWTLEEANGAIDKFKSRGYNALITDAKPSSFWVCVENRYTVSMEIADNSLA